ncbi:V-type proton ATPase subunit E-like protein, partial [Trifolium pratense]
MRPGQCSQYRGLTATTATYMKIVPVVLWKFKRKEKMKDADVSKQIQQMIRFIRQEAEEKANEISVSAEE